MTEIPFFPYFDKVVKDYEATATQAIDSNRYMDNFRHWVLETHGAQMISDDYGSNRTTPVFRFKTEQAAVLFTLRYR